MKSAPYRTSGYAYGYHHPSRVQSPSLDAIHPFDRTPFSAAGYGHYPEFTRIEEPGAMGMQGDSKQRKHRENFSEETRGKLRAWLVAHLDRPFPNKYEKQDLMHQTGLSKIDSLSSHSGESTIFPSTERGEFDDGKRSSVLLSEADVFDEDLDSLKHQSSAQIKRGSV
ncbi:hypothetical protein CH35J_006549 [Colletotrichum higginsianum]|uniref:KN homeodomain domain-containing protein n=1 Tax=Colletotrichum higginsianum TaxID=80884 RepID=A0A4T0VWV4_9PEZI|nr:hypothetical protein CH35J_006549 [Colletotrichum higginsianum]